MNDRSPIPLSGAPPASPGNGSIVVVGSLNMDLVMRMQRAPAAGETLPGHGFATLPGGKGANQAVACARLGGRVALVGRVGADANGTLLLSALADDGVDATEVGPVGDVATGVAMIWVEDDGENRIVLAPGANGRLDADDVERAGALIDAAALLILQLEVPMATVEAAAARARRAGVRVLLNPAPAAPLGPALWSCVDILVVNESEATALSGVDVADPESAARAAACLRQRGPQQVLVTLGAQGVVSADGRVVRHAPAQPVRAVDTTAAGDTFIGGVAVALCEGRSLDEAIALGQAASALCVARLGAQASIPWRRELANESAT